MCGTVRRSPKFAPDAKSMMLLGPGVIDEAKENKIRARSSSAGTRAITMIGGVGGLGVGSAAMMATSAGKEKAAASKGGQDAAARSQRQGRTGADPLVQGLCLAQFARRRGPGRRTTPPPDVTVPQGRRRENRSAWFVSEPGGGGPILGRREMDPQAGHPKGGAGYRAVLCRGLQGPGCFVRAVSALSAVSGLMRDLVQHVRRQAQVRQVARRERLQFRQRLAIDAMGAPRQGQIFADLGQPAAKAPPVGDRAIARNICHLAPLSSVSRRVPHGRGRVSSSPPRHRR